MKLNSLPFFIAILASTSLVILYNYYAQLKYQYNQLVAELDKETELKNTYLKEAKLLYQLDTKRTQELNHAKAEITRLTDDLHNGTKRLYVKAVCAKSDNITASSGLDDARPAQLAPDARRNYLRLRRQLETLEAQYLGLRERVSEIYKQQSK
ncbi:MULTISPECIES: lysis system i-spanin subunit Rz [Arsenophonus]|jgi:prophage endopeptidase|uniref:lysis system i-spanin subunit Rz n=1 Tax=Arsenophonus TaxID=637 RepID=UPI0015D73B5F|nr:MULTISPECIES: lysis system i-spanin subunit Rz [Arsenophonus]UBX30294.1 lysis protein [Arsenophonus apicola]